MANTEPKGQVSPYNPHGIFRQNSHYGNILKVLTLIFKRPNNIAEELSRLLNNQALETELLTISNIIHISKKYKSIYQNPYMMTAYLADQFPLMNIEDINGNVEITETTTYLMVLGLLASEIDRISEIYKGRINFSKTLEFLKLELSSEDPLNVFLDNLPDKGEYSRRSAEEELDNHPPHNQCLTPEIC